jgi:hypothetical protein
MSMLVSSRAHVDPNNVPLASLVAQEEHFVVNFIRNNNFNNSAYRNNFGSNNYRPYPSTNGNGYGNSYGSSSNNNSVTSPDFIKFWGEIFVFVLYVLIEISQGFKTF